MIPIKLKMRNFMCYRDNVPPLHFAGIHTACISGDNGNGKSALIDAMTWALWGRARAKSDNELVYQGQAEMEVEFDFAVGEQSYRIIRKHARPRRRGRSGQSLLEFQLAAGNGFRSISGEGIARTQQKIIEVLRMDYDTFANSALLRQGHADEFTIKRPAERKQVLADILGLSFYDELESQARDRAHQQEAEAAQLESAIRDIADTLTQKPAFEAELKQAQADLSHIEEELAAQKSGRDELRRQKDLLENKKLQLTQLEERIGEKGRELGRWDDQIKQHQARLKEYQALLDQRLNIEEGYARFREAKQLLEVLDQKFRQSVALNERKHQLEMAIERAQAALLTEHKLAQTRMAGLEARFQKLPGLKNKLQQIQAQLHQLADDEEKLRPKKAGLQEGQTQVNYLESNNAQLAREIEEIDGKLKLLLSPSSLQEGEAKCPLCERALAKEGLQLIETKYRRDRESKAASLKSNQAELTRRKTELTSLEKEVSRLETGLNQAKATAQGNASALSQQITEAEEAGSQLNEETRRLAEIEERLARKEFASLEQPALRDVEAELAGLGYDAPQHELVRQRLAGLQPYESQHQRLEEAHRLINQARESVSRAEAASQELGRSLELDSQKKQALITGLGLLPQVEKDLAQAETAYEALVARQKQAQETMWQAQARLQYCSELETKKKEKEKRLSQAAREEGIYKDLAEAFGKRGIQALLIETALPEIEAEANRLLARMTDNRMHVKIETQRETQKGEAAETLDIKISDELGTRNYEMFSGGEAFRINFAIRIALSRLLARRAGAPLPTLVIDEGFGTQDSAGLEKVKEAINSIQDDFEKILVITHIEELRDAFPSRINVIKTAEGSKFEVS